MMTAPNWNASAFQLGAVIIQKGKLVALYGRKLTYDQQRYTVTDKEVLIIIETLKWFRSISIVQKLRIYTDHKISHVRILIPIEY